MKRATLPAGMTNTIAGSAGVHVGVMILFVLIGRFSPGDPPPRQNFIATRLVKLGKKRDQALLPRKPSSPPPPAPAAVPATPKPVPPAPKPAKNPPALDRAQERAKVSSALDRLKNMSQEESEGDPEGVRGGEVSDLSRAIEGNKYATEIYRCLKKNYQIEGVAKAKLVDRQVTVLLTVRADGRFGDSKLMEGSGLPSFDRAVQRAVKRCGRVSPPPESLREAIISDGIEVVFKP